MERYDKLYNNFSVMFRRCKTLLYELEKDHKIKVTNENNSYIQVAWPKKDENKYYSKPIVINFGGAFNKEGNNITKNDMSLAKEYIFQVRMAKKYGRLLLAYASLLDEIKEGRKDKDDNNLEELALAMEELYELTIKSKKERKK